MIRSDGDSVAYHSKQSVLEILEYLAEGVNPITGEDLPSGPWDTPKVVNSLLDLAERLRETDFSYPEEAEELPTALFQADLPIPKNLGWVYSFDPDEDEGIIELIDSSELSCSAESFEQEPIATQELVLVTSVRGYQATQTRKLQAADTGILLSVVSDRAVETVWRLRCLKRALILLDKLESQAFLLLVAESEGLVPTSLAAKRLSKVVHRLSGTDRKKVERHLAKLFTMLNEWELSEIMSQLSDSEKRVVRDLSRGR
jgi:hypothetical protein